MATYDVWNDALINYLTARTLHGSTIFLDINEDILEDVGHTLKGSAPKGWVDDFKHAVRAKVIEGQKICLENIDTYKDQDFKLYPQGVAFLGIMVLAAYYMSEDEDASSVNYFKRLRNVLGLETEERRLGLPIGSEERLWTEWNTWLQSRGFIPTAQRGAGPKTYINYPISQSLLRQADKDKLEKLFEERHWPQRLDQNIIAARIRRETTYLSKHIQHILQEGSVQRFQALMEDIFEVYENWVTYGRTGSRIKVGVYTTQRSLRRNINAGLYRVVDSLLGTVEYCLYPRQPHRGHPVGLQVKHDDASEDLIADGPKWYRPLWKLSANDLDQGNQYELVGNSEFQYLILSKKDFWILILDPIYPESGMYIAAESLDIGTPFILLCRQELQNQINRLKNERLVQWHNDPHSLSDYPGWVEYRDMMVVGEAWSGVSRALENQDLYESLRPLASIGIHFEGGMRAPKADIWLDEYGPKIIFSSFDAKAHILVQTISKDRNILLDKEVPTNTPLTIPWSGPGDYFVEASIGTKAVTRIVQIHSWHQLMPLPIEQSESIKIGKWDISGALIRLVDEAK
jgi:hypothetical protein